MQTICERQSKIEKKTILEHSSSDKENNGQKGKDQNKRRHSRRCFKEEE